MADTIFKNVLKVAEYLKSLDFKVEKSTIYNDVKAGWLPKNAGGGFLKSIVDVYAKKSGFEKNFSGGDGELVNMQKKKLAAELRKVEAQAETWENKARDNDDSYVKKSTFNKELAARASILKTGLKDFVYREADEIIRISGGNKEKSGEVVSYCIKCIEVVLGQYSDPRVSWPKK